MKFNFTKLDQETRTLMIEEICTAEKSSQHYYSRRFTTSGTANWITWLTDAARTQDEHWLAYQIEIQCRHGGF